MSELTLDLIEGTPVGVVLAAACEGMLRSVGIGLGSPRSAIRWAEKRLGASKLTLRPNEPGRQLRQYFAKRRREFELDVALDKLPPFYRRVLDACRRVEYGRVVTYGELAAAAGSPRAFRAVGGALRSNPCAIVIPCHRVVACDGIGGFSAPGGVRTKRALLRLEGLGSLEAL